MCSRALAQLSELTPGPYFVEAVAVEIRTSLIEVAPLPGNEHALDGSPGGFTNFYALAPSDQDFRTSAKLAMESLGLSVLGIDEVLVVDPDAQTDRTEELLAGLTEDSPWLHDPVHTYERDE